MGTIHVLGPDGTYGHEVAELILQQHSGMNGYEISFCSSNDAILKAVVGSTEENVLGLVPIENSTAGLVKEVIGFWMKRPDDSISSPIQVIGEVSLPIHHCLLSHPSITHLSRNQAVMSHPQALSQCAGNLARLGLTKEASALSTAAAAQHVAEYGDTEAVVAIASRFAAEVHGLKIHHEGLEDENANETRFHLIGKVPTTQVSNAKTAILFWLKDEPAALHDAMGAIASARANMSSIHSIPLGRKGEFAFYVEFEGHLNNEVTDAVLTILRARTDRLVILGSFSEIARHNPTL